MNRSAVISPCGVYRYVLTREWGQGACMVVIGLNPSTADASQDDPTIRRCVGFALREECGSLVMLNLFAIRSTDPSVLTTSTVDPVGPANDAWLDRYSDADLVVAAWGAHPAAKARAAAVAAGLPGLQCLGFTKNGSPRHPLYVRGDAPLVPFHPRVTREGASGG